MNNKKITKKDILELRKQKKYKAMTDCKIIKLHNGCGKNCPLQEEIDYCTRRDG